MLQGRISRTQGFWSLRSPLVTFDFPTYTPIDIIRLLRCLVATRDCDRGEARGAVLADVQPELIGRFKLDPRELFATLRAPVQELLRPSVFREVDLTPGAVS